MIFASFCDTCTHQRENIDGWKCACDAFPEGIPANIFRGNPSKLEQCNNGIGYKFNEEKRHLLEFL